MMMKIKKKLKDMKNYLYIYLKSVAATSRDNIYMNSVVDG